MAPALSDEGAPPPRQAVAQGSGTRSRREGIGPRHDAKAPARGATRGQQPETRSRGAGSPEGAVVLRGAGTQRRRRTPAAAAGGTRATAGGRDAKASARGTTRRHRREARREGNSRETRSRGAGSPEGAVVLRGAGTQRRGRTPAAAGGGPGQRHAIATRRHRPAVATRRHRPAARREGIGTRHDAKASARGTTRGQQPKMRRRGAGSPEGAVVLRGAGTQRRGRTPAAAGGGTRATTGGRDAKASARGTTRRHRREARREGNSQRRGAAARGRPKERLCSVAPALSDEGAPPPRQPVAPGQRQAARRWVAYRTRPRAATWRMASTRPPLIPSRRSCRFATTQAWFGSTRTRSPTRKLSPRPPRSRRAPRTAGRSGCAGRGSSRSRQAAGAARRTTASCCPRRAPPVRAPAR